MTTAKEISPSFEEVRRDIEERLSPLRQEPLVVEVLGTGEETYVGIRVSVRLPLSEESLPIYTSHHSFIRVTDRAEVLVSSLTRPEAQSPASLVAEVKAAVIKEVDTILESLKDALELVRVRIGQALCD